MKNEMQTTNNELREIQRPELAKQILNSNWKTETWMTRALLAFGIVLLFSLPARAQQPAPADNGQQSNKPPVQPGQTAAPAQAPNLSPPPSPTPQPQTGQSQPQGQQGAGKPKQNPAQSRDRHSLTVTTNLVIVPVTVKNHDGALIGDLQRDEFRVFCDNVEQQIIFFTSDPFPLSAVVLIDNDLSIKSAEEVQKSLTAISAGFGPADEVALVTYNEFTNVVSDFSFNNDQLYTKLKRLELDSHIPGSPVGGPLTAGPTANGRNTETGQPTQLGVRQEPTHKDMD